MTADGLRPRVLILVENLPLQRDARVKRECRALLEADVEVHVVCQAAADGTAVEADLADVHLHAYPVPPEGAGALRYVAEYMYSLIMMAIQVTRVRARGPVDVVQACNPPDLLFLIAVPLQWLGARFVFDHHDLSPELFDAQFGQRLSALRRLLVWCERRSIRAADHVLSTNDTFRRIAVTRGGVAPDRVSVVRNAPERRRVERTASDPSLRAGRTFLCCWIGIMGFDEGLDVALRAIAHLIHDVGRRDCTFAFIGDGEQREDATALARRLAIDPWVRFPGWLAQDDAFTYLATADIALAPDRDNSHTQLSTNIKIVEYLAFGLPIVATDLAECRVVARDAARYVPDDDPVVLATAIDDVLDAPEARRAMSVEGRTHFRQTLAWEHQREVYLRVLNGLTDRSDIRDVT